MAKKFSLIKQMNEQVDRSNQVVDQTKLNEADASPTANDIKAKFGSLRELQRIANYWQKHGQDMDDAELRERIGMDLEQLDYTPDQQAEAIPKIMEMIRGGENYTNVAEQYLREQLEQAYGVLVLQDGTTLALDGQQAHRPYTVHKQPEETGDVIEMITKYWDPNTNPVVSIDAGGPTTGDELSVVLNKESYGPDEVQQINQQLQGLIRGTGGRAERQRDMEDSTTDPNRPE